MKPLNLRSTTDTLKNLLDMFDQGELRLPAFQRPFVWKIGQTMNLLDSLLRGFPISVIYLWEPSPDSRLKPKARTFRKRNETPEIDRFKAYIIDGQQRLTSLHAAFGYSEAFDERNGRSLECWLNLVATDNREGRITKLFESPARKAFLERSDHQESPIRVRLCELLNSAHQEMRDGRRKILQEHGLEEDRIAIALSRIDAAYQMLATPITTFTITQSDDEEVLQVFKRLNRGGTGLRERDVKAADLGIGKPVDVLQRIQAFVSKQTPRALGFGFPFAFRTLVVFHRGNAQFNKLGRTWAEMEGDRGQNLDESWSEAEDALIQAMAFVDQIGWSRKPLLPSCNALLPLAYALHRLGREIKSQERATILRWFCLGALRRVFHGSVETKINKHLRKIREAKSPIEGLLESLTVNERRSIKPDELMREPTTLWGPSSQVMFAWLVSCGAKDWISGESLDSIARRGLASTHPDETLSVHHIFPRKLLASQEYEVVAANYPSNFAIIAKSSNSSLSDLSPDDALQHLDSHEKHERARMQMFSKDAGDLLRPDRYDEFLGWRAKRLAEALNKWLGLD